MSNNRISNLRHSANIRSVFEPLRRMSGYVTLHYCKTLNICGNKLSRFNDNDVLAYFNFGGHDLPWLQIDSKENLM